MRRQFKKPNYFGTVPGTAPPGTVVLVVMLPVYLVVSGNQLRDTWYLNFRRFVLFLD